MSAQRPAPSYLYGGRASAGVQWHRLREARLHSHWLPNSDHGACWWASPIRKPRPICKPRLLTRLTNRNRLFRLFALRLLHWFPPCRNFYRWSSRHGRFEGFYCIAICQIFHSDAFCGSWTPLTNRKLSSSPPVPTDSFHRTNILGLMFELFIIFTADSSPYFQITNY